MSSNEIFSSQMAGMSKGQLYDIMLQMKTLTEQNRQQAKKILVDNPQLTKALFQAQILLGMVQPPKVMPNIQKPLSKNPQQSMQVGQQLNIQTRVQGQASSSQSPIPIQEQRPNQPAPSTPSISASPVTHSSLISSLHSLQTGQQSKLTSSSQAAPVSVPHPSRVHNTPLPLNPSPQPSTHQSQKPILSCQTQQSLQNVEILVKPPLPSQPRPPLVQPYPHQVHSQVTPNLGFTPSQQLPSSSIFHPGSNNPQAGIGSSFPHGPPPLPNHLPPQPAYKVSSHSGVDFSSHAGSSVKVDRGPTWMPGLPENTTGGAQLPGPQPIGSGQFGSGIQSPRPQFTPEMEKALLRQVMTLTPEQINLLAPEQRNQVFQLQKMLR